MSICILTDSGENTLTVLIFLNYNDYKLPDSCQKQTASLGEIIKTCRFSKRSKFGTERSNKTCPKCSSWSSLLKRWGKT